MTTTKLHINIDQGILEVEGEEKFVRDIYENFKAEFLKGHDVLGSAVIPPTKIKKAAKNKKTHKNKSDKNSSKKKQVNTIPNEPKIDKTLDLSGIKDAPSLRDFVNLYQPKTNLERNVVFIEYLKDKIGLEKVTMNHVWTCYDGLKLKLPVNMKQSLYDTSSSKAWINVPSLADLSLSVQGKNWLRDQAKKVEAA